MTNLRALIHCPKRGQRFTRNVTTDRHGTNCKKHVSEEGTEMKSEDEDVKDAFMDCNDIDDEEPEDKTFDADNKEYEDDTSTEIDLDEVTRNQGNAAVHQSNTDLISASNTSSNLHSAAHRSALSGTEKAACMVPSCTAHTETPSDLVIHCRSPWNWKCSRPSIRR